MLFRSIHSIEDDATRMVEVSVSKKSLDAHGTFLLHTPSKVYIWHGRQASPQTRESVKKYIDLGDPENGVAEEKEGDDHDTNVPKIVTLEHGHEPEDFWDWFVLYGEDEPEEALAQDTRPLGQSFGGAKKLVGDRAKARLVCFSYEAGNFVAREVTSFTQTDLECSKAFLLDSFLDGGDLILWLGKNITENLLAAARHIGKLYENYVQNKKVSFPPPPPSSVSSHSVHCFPLGV